MKPETPLNPLRIPSAIVLAPGFSEAPQAVDRTIPAWVWLLVIGGMLVGWWLLERRRLQKTEAAAEALNPASPLYRHDDLRVIAGIGPNEERLLHEHAVKTYAQLAISDPVFLQNVFRDAGLNHIDSEAWIVQARMAAAHDWPGLAAYQRAHPPGSNSHA